MSLQVDDATPGRLRLTAYATAQLVLAVPALVLFVLSLVGSVMLIVWVGALILVVTVPATRWVANRHRAMAARVLGVPRPAPYRPLPPGPVLGKLITVVSDPMTWRDLGWLAWAFTLGFVHALICVLELLLVVTVPVWWYGIRFQMRARAHVDLFFLASSRTDELRHRVEVLTSSRADVVDHAAAELRRVERDLHDGAQARLVALSMNLGMADNAFDSDPEAARRLVVEARETTGAALADLRSVVRGIHPPVLADRGLGGAVEAMALHMALPVDVTVRLEGRPSAPVESALYFAVAECLANIGKHARAGRAWITVAHAEGVLRVEIGDNGHGGADPSAGTGLLGVTRRLAGFDGTMWLSSPVGGPTLITLEVPCDLCSPKTMPS